MITISRRVGETIVVGKEILVSVADLRPTRVEIAVTECGVVNSFVLQPGGSQYIGKGVMLLYQCCQGGKAQFGLTPDSKRVKIHRLEAWKSGSDECGEGGR